MSLVLSILSLSGQWDAKPRCWQLEMQGWGAAGRGLVIYSAVEAASGIR